MHVDGAFGMWAAVSPRYAHLLEGFTDADSWAIDCHKWLNVPYDSGVALVRWAEHLRRACALSAAYLQTAEVREPCHDIKTGRLRRARIWHRIVGRFAVLGRDEHSGADRTKLPAGESS